MLLSNLFFKTFREEPKEAEIASHRLMLRAGIIMKSSSGIYHFLPLGYKVLQKVINIVREEMNRIGAQELLMPVLLPKEIMDETARWELYGDELMKLKDRHNHNFCLGPTHEEAITDIVRNYITSYRELPITLYQIQEKFRDEKRPRYGLLRTREFLMKDAYSFDKNEEELDKDYNTMFDAYCRIFKRCGLTFKVVEAFTGAIGGKVSHEFMAEAKDGEDKILYCPNCNYAANLARAESEQLPLLYEYSQLKPIEEVETPNLKKVEEVAHFLNVKKTDIIKTLIYNADGEQVAFLIRGEQELNEEKVKENLRYKKLEMARKEQIENLTKADVGFSGPINLNIKIIADNKVKDMKNFVTGANKNNKHLINVNFGRDFIVDEFADITYAKEGELCIRCKKGSLILSKCIEVGHIFKLYNKYTQAMNCYYIDKDNKKCEILMGCYGIGISRIIVAAIEQNNDKEGIIWPVSIAPYHVIVIPVKKEGIIIEKAKSIYNKLLENNIEVVLDDRELTPGVKFKDADLVGIPLQIIVGKSIEKENKFEIKIRKNNERIFKEENEVIEFVNGYLYNTGL